MTRSGLRRASLRRAGSSGGAGTDHGSLAGLADDDHPQYFLKATDSSAPNLAITDANHGNRTGGTLHAAAVAGVSAGFMSAVQATTLSQAINGSNRLGMSVIGRASAVDGAAADITGAAAGYFLGSAEGTSLAFVPILQGFVVGMANTSVPYSVAGTMATDAAKLYFDATNILFGVGGTASHTLDVVRSVNGNPITAAVRNTSNTASSSARMLVEVAGTSGGDPHVRLRVVGATTWDLTCKNGTSDELQFIYNADSTNTTVFRQLITGQATLGGNIAPDADYILTLYSGTANQAIKQKIRGSGVSSRAMIELAPDGGNGFAELFGNGASLAGLVQGQTAAALAGMTAGGDIDRLMMGIAGNKSLIFATNSVLRLTMDGAGNVVMGTAAIATTATDGFPYVPMCAGAPTGIPTAYAGRGPIVIDSTNHKLYFYDGTWRDAGPP